MFKSLSAPQFAWDDEEAVGKARRPTRGLDRVECSNSPSALNAGLKGMEKSSQLFQDPNAPLQFYCAGTTF